MKVGNTMNIRMMVASKYLNIPHFLLFKHRRMIIVFEVKLNIILYFFALITSYEATVLNIANAGLRQVYTVDI